MCFPCIISFNLLNETLWTLLLPFCRRKLRHRDVEQIVKVSGRTRIKSSSAWLGIPCSWPFCPPASNVYSLIPSLLIPSDHFFPGWSLPLPTLGPHGPPSQQPEQAHLAVAVASKFGDEADVIIPDLNHLLTDVVLGADAALCARPPGQKVMGSVWVLALHARVGQAPSTR